MSRTSRPSLTVVGTTAKPFKRSVVKLLLKSSGNQVFAGGLNAGMMIVYVDDGAAFRLLWDPASAAIQVVAQAGAVAAIAAVQDAFPVMRTVMKAFATTIKSAFLTETDSEGQFELVNGSIPTSDLSEGIYVPAIRPVIIGRVYLQIRENIKSSGGAQRAMALRMTALRFKLLSILLLPGVAAKLFFFRVSTWLRV